MLLHTDVCKCGDFIKKICPDPSAPMDFIKQRTTEADKSIDK